MTQEACNLVCIVSVMIISASCGPSVVINECHEGNVCNGARAFCCQGETILNCVGGIFEVHEECSGEIAMCEDGRSSCRCDVEDIGCRDDTTEQRCLPGLGTMGHLETLPCPGNETCTAGEGCGQCYDTCVVGVLGCSSDGREVLECQRVTLDSCAYFIPVVSCAERGMICTDSGVPTAEPSELCTNECGGMQVLEHEVCEPAEPGEPPCAVYVCNGQGQLQLDHIGCLAGGAQCQSDEQCASCRCSGGTCEGTTWARCPSASLCPD